MNDHAQKAKALFRRLFDEEAKSDPVNLPTYFVTRHVFHSECRKAGIPVPENFIAAVQWEESIGFPEFVHRIVAAYHKAHGSDFTPMEKGAWKLRKQKQRNNRIAA